VCERERERERERYLSLYYRVYRAVTLAEQSFLEKALIKMGTANLHWAF
jgi:hypothetical protein